MAYFECIAGNGGSGGGGIPLIVTCDSQFASTTITASDGTTTLTSQCPSSSPYTVEFELPNDGTWTISGTISGITYSESVIVQAYNIELKSNINISVDLYSAANDTVSYIGIDNQTHTITTDSNGHASATITIRASGSTFEFISSVAKDPNNLSNAYSKSIALLGGTTKVYVCPDGAIYWYGYEKEVMQGAAYITSTTPNDAVVSQSDAAAPEVSKGINAISLSEQNSLGMYVCTKQFDFSSYSNLKCLVNSAGVKGGPNYNSTCDLRAINQNATSYTSYANNTMLTSNGQTAASISSPTIKTASLSSVSTSGYVGISTRMAGSSSGGYSNITFAALWLE